MDPLLKTIILRRAIERKQAKLDAILEYIEEIETDIDVITDLKNKHRRKSKRLLRILYALA